MHIDPLESRTHFSTATVVRTGNILTITGTSGADEIFISGNDSTINIIANGQSQDLSRSVVRTVRIFGLSGSDKIVVSRKFRIRCSIEAGSGNDIVEGSANDDTLYGGRGNDTLTGNLGHDYIDGGLGKDYINCIRFDYNDVCHGGGGSDTVAYWENIYCTGIETFDEQWGGFGEFPYPNILSSIRREDGKTILNVGENIGSQDDITFQPLFEESPGVYTIESEWNIRPSAAEALPSQDFDVTALKGSTIIFKQSIIDHTFSNNVTHTTFEYPLFIHL